MTASTGGLKPIGLEPEAWRWTREPASYTLDGDDTMRWSCVSGSDLWRHTASGVVRHNGHGYMTDVSGDFMLQGHFSAPLETRYDQVGLLAIRSETRWVKASAEWDGELLVGAVHTAGSSDWSLGRGTLPVGVRLQRRGETLEVFAEDQVGEWRMIRQLRLGGVLAVGPYSCAPIGPGFEATVSGLRLAAG